MESNGLPSVSSLFNHADRNVYVLSYFQLEFILYVTNNEVAVMKSLQPPPTPHLALFMPGGLSARIVRNDVRDLAQYRFCFYALGEQINKLSIRPHQIEDNCMIDRVIFFIVIIDNFIHFTPVDTI